MMFRIAGMGFVFQETEEELIVAHKYSIDGETVPLGTVRSFAIFSSSSNTSLAELDAFLDENFTRELVVKTLLHNNGLPTRMVFTFDKKSGYSLPLLLGRKNGYEFRFYPSCWSPTKRERIKVTQKGTVLDFIAPKITSGLLQEVNNFILGDR